MTEEKRINNSFSHNEELFHDLKVLFILLSITILLFIVNSLTTQSVTNSADSSELKDFLTGVTITDINNNPLKDETLYVGEQYKIELKFQEGDAQGRQLKKNADGNLTYQIPKAFKVDKIDNVDLKVIIDGEEKVIGTYSIDENGFLTIQVTEDGQTALDSSDNISFSFNVTVTAQTNPDGEDNSVHFGDTGGSFDFNLTDDAKIEVEKQGYYTEDKKGTDGSNPTGGILSYTVKTTVEHGEVHDVVISDVLTPPKNESFTIKPQGNGDVPNVKITIKKADSETPVELESKDYEVKSVVQDSEGEYQQKSFELKINDSCNCLPLQEGDIVEVTYEYRVEYHDKGDKYWDEVSNSVNVEGKQKIKDPESQEKEKDVSDSQETKVGVSRKPIGGGKIVKDQEYNEKKNSLHYSIYAVVPQGTWEPFFIYDGMNTNINGENYSLSEFNKDGRVTNVKVSAIDLEPSMITWTDETWDVDLLNQLKKVKGDKKELDGFDYYSKSLDGYNSESMDQYLYRLGGTMLHIMFGVEEGQNQDGNWDKWGHWKYEEDRLIIVEYDLDLSDDTLLLKKDSEEEAKEFSKEEVLKSGITNTVQLHYGGYSMGTYAFYNDAKKIEKKGTFDKNTNTIDYSVSLNTTDNDIRAYLASVSDDWNTSGQAHGWQYSYTMQAAFYDVLPEGWEYVPGSLYAVSLSWGTETKWTYENKYYSEYKKETIDGIERNIIDAPLGYFRINEANGNYRDMYAATFKDPNVTQLTFHYKLKATEEFIKEHANDLKDTIVQNTASIKDTKGVKFSDNTDVLYFPTRLIKNAKQEGSTNLMRFTLEVNPSGVDLDKNNDFLIVTDKSNGLQVQTETITVKDSNDKMLEYKGIVTQGQTLSNNEWGLIESDSEDEGQFKLKVPDSEKLTITYDAYIIQLGNDVEVSNSASIDSVVRSDTNYSGTLQVNDFYGTGEGNTYKLTIVKSDQDLTSKKLSGAKFEYCIVVTKDSMLEKTEDIKIDGKTYPCYKENGWEFTTDTNGKYEIKREANWKLAPNNYYILKEIEAPPGYYLSEEPILFYYGAENQIDKENYPTAVFALPNGTLNITNEKTHNIPRTGSIGTRVFYVTGLLLIILAISLIYKKSKIK